MVPIYRPKKMIVVRAIIMHYLGGELKRHYIGENMNLCNFSPFLHSA